MSEGGAELDALNDRAPQRPPGPLGWALGALNAIGTLWIGLLMALVVADIVGRGFLNAPILGVAEVAAKSIIGIVFLQIGATIHSGRMTRADMFYDRLLRTAPRAAHALEAVFCALGFLVFLVIARSSLPYFLESWAQDEFFGVQGVWTLPTWPVRGIIVLGAGAACVAYLAALAACVRQGLRA